MASLNTVMSVSEVGGLQQQKTKRAKSLRNVSNTLKNVSDEELKQLGRKELTV